MARAGGPSSILQAGIGKVVDGPDKPGHDMVYEDRSSLGPAPPRYEFPTTSSGRTPKKSERFSQPV